MSSTLIRIAVVATFVCACTEPVDCHRERERCFGVRPALTVRAHQKPTAAQPRVEAPPSQPVARGDETDTPPPWVAQRVLGQPLPGHVNPEVARGLGGRDAEIEQIKVLLGQLGSAAKGHDLAALQPFVTERLETHLQEIVAQHGERLWRHLDKFARAGSAEAQVLVEAGDASDKRQVVVTVPDGAPLKPIVQQTATGWRFDRF
jgi:hypothetical protein